MKSLSRLFSERPKLRWIFISGPILLTGFNAFISITPITEIESVLINTSIIVLALLCIWDEVSPKHPNKCITVFEHANDAEAYCCNGGFVDNAKGKRAIILFHSFRFGENLLTKILQNKKITHVEVYIKDPSTAINESERKKIESGIEELIRVIEADREDHPNRTISARLYVKIASCRAVLVEDEFILIGHYIYTKSDKYECRIFGHDCLATVFFRGCNDFSDVKRFFFRVRDGLEDKSKPLYPPDENNISSPERH